MIVRSFDDNDDKDDDNDENVIDAVSEGVDRKEPLQGL